MGSLATHLSTFMFLVPIGVHRLYSSISLFLKDPSFYHSKPWFFFEPKWKNFDLFVLIVILPIASLSDFIIFLSFSGHPTYRFSFLQHGLVILLFWALLILIIMRESYDLSCFNDSFVFFLGGVCFVVDYFVSGNGFSGVSNIVYELLGELTLVCAFSCLYLSVKPNAFFADFFLSMGIIFKGTWALQAGMNLYTNVFGLKGCHVLSLLPGDDKVDVKCDLGEDSLRGVALMKFLFVGHAVVVVATCLGFFGLLSNNQHLRCNEGGGPLLARVESNAVMMHSLPEVDVE